MIVNANVMINQAIRPLGMQEVVLGLVPLFGAVSLVVEAVTLNLEGQRINAEIHNLERATTLQSKVIKLETRLVLAKLKNDAQKAKAAFEKIRHRLQQVTQERRDMTLLISRAAQALPQTHGTLRRRQLQQIITSTTRLLERGTQKIGKGVAALVEHRLSVLTARPREAICYKP
jgi:hypothetical protein